MQIKLEISDETIINAITDALEGGSNDWYWIDASVLDSVDLVFSPEERGQLSNGDRVAKAIVSGKIPSVAVLNIDNRDEVCGHLTIDTIKSGLQKLYAEDRDVFPSIVSETSDSYDADTFLQFCLFGEVIYS